LADIGDIIILMDSGRMAKRKPKNLKTPKNPKDESTSGKGVMSAIAFFVTISALLIAHIFLISNVRTRSLTSENLIADRIYYIYGFIEHSVVEIIEEELGSIIESITMNVTVDEQQDFSYVTFTEKLPQNVSDFNEDLSKYEDFVENYLNETNIEIKTTISGLGGNMKNVIEPYGITYTHDIPWGNGDKRQYEVTPGENESSLDYVNAYTISVQLINGWEVMPERAQWGPKKDGDLKFNITIISYDGQPVYSTEEYLDRTDKSEFKIDTNTTLGGYFEGWVRAVISDTYNSGLLFEMHLCEGIVSTELNLTDVPEETRIDLPGGKINVVETLYNIEKNGTVGLS